MREKSTSKRRGARTLPQVITPPPEITAQIDRITNEDREWFESHPEAGLRERPPAPGEFWPVMDSASVLYVIVTQVRPGFRLRLPVFQIQLPTRPWIQ